MKEHGTPTPTRPAQPPVLKGRGYSIGKRWRKVNSLTHANDLKMLNDNIEAKYHRVLKAIKDLYLPPTTQYFERDYKYDGRESLSLHTFVCDQVYLHLECDYHCDMRIEYAFHSFEHENKVLKLLRFPIYLEKATNKVSDADLPAFFKRIIAFQEPRYIHFL